MSYVLRQARQEENHALKQKALESQLRTCNILHKKVSILVEYPDYKNPHVKGEEGAIYCENIIQCYQNNIRCRYSGISPSYPDPFLGPDLEVEETDDGSGDPRPEEESPQE